ncbi:MAG: hypothetical protein RIR88_79 [Actinomycetota bacterium]
MAAPRIATMRLAPTRRRVAAFVLSAILSFIGLSAVLPASAQDGVTATISPTSAFAAAPGDAFRVTVTLTNSGKTPVPAGKAVLTARAAVLNTVASLDDWLSGADGDTQPGWLLQNATTPEVPAGQTIEFVADVDLAKANFGQTWGPRGLSIDLIAGGNSVAHGRGALLWTAGTAPSPVATSIILPIVAPSSSAGTLSATELTELTSATGSLTRQLGLASSRGVVLAVDPRITVSIAALGTGVPESVMNWLNKLKALPNESFELAYGDADLAGQLQARAATVLVPGTSDLAPAASTSQVSGSSAPAASSVTPQTTASLPRVFSPTLSQVAWPATNSAVTATLPGLVSSGFSSVLLASSNLDTRALRPSSATVGRLPTAVVNAGLSSALTDAATAAASSGGTSRAIAYAAAAALDSSTGNRVTGALPRQALTETTSAPTAAVLDALSGQSWLNFSGIAAALVPGAPAATVVDRPESTDRIAQISALQGRWGEVGVFSSVTSAPAFVVNPASRALASTLSVSWLTSGDWSRGIAGYLSATGKTLSSIEVVTSSDINMVGGQANIPVAVHNALNEPVTVRVQAKASNNRIAVTGEATITIQPDSQGKALIPVEARVSTGSALLEVTLFSNSGAVIGTPATIPINVRADWEAWGLGAFAVAFVGLVSAGIVRTMRRRRSRAAE